MSRFFLISVWRIRLMFKQIGPFLWFDSRNVILSLCSIYSKLELGASLSRLQLLLVDFHYFLVAPMKDFFIEVLGLFCMQIETVKVNNVFPGVFEWDIKEFFPFLVTLNILKCRGMSIDFNFCLWYIFSLFNLRQTLGIFSRAMKLNGLKLLM